MNIGIIVFTYNRSQHLKKVLNGLKKNQGISKLYVFQDGLKLIEHLSEWKKVQKIIEDINWCKVIYNQSSYNKGLAKSIVDGINIVFEENDAVIVLEDDCVPTSNFIIFMRQCFEKYYDNKKIYSISGYSWPIELQQTQYDIYGCGRISSWGWGTWKDRWNIYEKDYELIKKMKQDENMSRNLAIWGQDLEDILVKNVKGICDSWAIFWALNVILRKGICINPYKSFIRNIGMDGSGVHCGMTRRFEVECIDENRKKFCLPDTIEVLKETISAFIPLYGSYTAINEQKYKSKVFVYGIGDFYLKNEKQINQEYYIEKFIDIYKNGYFAGKEIIRLDSIKNYSFEKLIIMVQDKEKSLNIAYEMIERFNISKEKIELGNYKYK